MIFFKDKLHPFLSRSNILRLKIQLPKKIAPLTQKLSYGPLHNHAPSFYRYGHCRFQQLTCSLYPSQVSFNNLSTGPDLDFAHEVVTVWGYLIHLPLNNLSSSSAVRGKNPTILGCLFIQCCQLNLKHNILGVVREVCTDNEINSKNHVIGDADEGKITILKANGQSKLA
jgi:hypothetical protein